MPSKYYKKYLKHENSKLEPIREPRTDQSCQSGTRHETSAYPTAAVAVMNFLREDARAMHEGAGKETIVDTAGESMATAAAAVSFGFESTGKPGASCRTFLRCRPYITLLLHLSQRPRAGGFSWVSSLVFR